HQPVAEPNDGVWQHAVDPQTLTEVPHEIDESLTNPLRPRATSPPDSPLAPPPVVAQPSAEIRPIPSPPSDQGPNWFKRLVQGSSAQQPPAAERLAAEGFGRVTRTDALMFLSPSTDDRKAMVDRVMTSPDLEAPAWLKLLLADRAPEV